MFIFGKFIGCLEFVYIVLVFIIMCDIIVEIEIGVIGIIGLLNIG